jgi:uncharacterized protein YigA (DUF484 family)
VCHAVHEVKDTLKCVKRIMKHTHTKKKEIEDMLTSLIAKAEENS